MRGTENEHRIIIFINHHIGFELQFNYYEGIRMISAVGGDWRRVRVSGSQG